MNSLIQQFNEILEHRVKKRTEKLKQLVMQLRLDITERKRIEDELRSSEERWKFALEVAGDGVWDYNLQTHEVFYSKSYQEMYHLTTDENGKLNHNWHDCVHPEDMPHLLENISAYLEGKTGTFATEYRMRCKDGSWKWILDRAMLVSRTKEGKPLRMIGTHSDITKRKQLEIQREQFFKFFNLARDIQCIVSLDGYFKQVNPAFSICLGFSKNELLEQPFIEFIAPEDRPRTLAEVKRLASNEVTLDFENRYLCKNGSCCWLSWKAVFEPSDELIYAVARDVTNFKKIEEKLQLAEMVYQNSIEAILVTDANNRIIAANPAFAEITGYTLDEVVGKTPNIFKSDRHSPEFYQTMWQDINTQGHWQGEIWDKRKNGDIHAKFLNINRILNKEGQVCRYLALFSDITARKQYEEEIKQLSDSELNKAKLEAEKANRAKSDFLSSMSHELRTPMNAVLGFAQLLESEDLTEDQLDSVKEILAAGHHLLDLINEVLDLSKIESEKLELNMEEIDLNTLMRNCVSLVQPLTLKNGIKIIDNMAHNCHLTVMGDSFRLKQILLNLISNAVKYNRTGGSVTLCCECSNAKTARINIVDTGNGLSELQVSKLFQPFERFNAKNSSIEGTGIGLCISKKLIDAMNGAIGVSSTVGKGSCFWIEIPLAQPIAKTGNLLLSDLTVFSD